MQGKKIVVLFLWMLMTAGLLTGCFYGRKKEVTLVLKAPTLAFGESVVDDEVRSSNDFLKKAGEAFARQYKDAEVTIKVVEYENTDEINRVEGCFDTEEAVDVLFNDYFTMEAHIHSGKVVPLDEVITEEIRRDIDKTFWDQSCLEGKTYMMPYLYRQNVLAYSNEWLRRAGMESYVSDGTEIQNWSMEEWEKILSAERKVMPETSYPLMMYAANNQGDTHIMCLIRSQGSTFFDENGKFHLKTPEGIAGLRWIKNCMEQRYMPENAAEIEILSCYEMFCSGQLGFFICNAAIEDDFKDYGLVNFPTVHGGCNTNFLTGFEVFDNGDPDKLAAAKAFLKYVYESEYLDYSTEAIPCSHKISEKYSDFLKPMQKYIKNAQKGINFTGGNTNWLGIRNIFYKSMQKLLSGEKTPEQAAEELDRDANRIIEEGKKNGSLHE